MRVLHSLAISLIICIMLLMQACSPSEESAVHVTATPSDEVISLKMWHIWATEADSNRAPFENSLAIWSKSHPNIQVDVEAYESETYKMKIRAAVAANEMPDIFFSWGAGFAEPFISTGKVLPLDDYIDDSIRTQLLPGTLDNFTYDDQIYALPTFIISGVLYCNTEILERYQLTPPDTFDELLAAVDVLQRHHIIPLSIGEKDGWPGIMHHNAITLQTAGIKLTELALDGQASFNQPEFIEAARGLQTLIEAGAFDPECLQTTAHEAEQLFINGRAAMYYSGSWAAGTFDRSDSAIKGKVAVKPFPRLNTSTVQENAYVGGAIDTFMISANTAYPDEAVETLIALDRIFSRESYLSGAGIPAWQMDDQDVSVSPIMESILELMEQSDGFVLAWDTVLTGDDANTYKDLVKGMFAGVRTAEEFAQQMQQMNEN